MQAIDAALKIYRRPDLVRAERRKVLPDNTLPLIRIASGSAIAPEFLTAERAKSEAEARDAAVFYIQQILLSPKSDEYRQLGLTYQATPQQISEHKRHMLKWLHPDRNPNKWESALFQRVVNAAGKLENRGTAASSGSKRNTPVNSYSPMRQKPHLQSQRHRTQIRTQSSNILRRLRTFVMIGSALLIVLLIAWRFYTGRWFDWYAAQVFMTFPATLIGGVKIMLEY